MKQPLLNAISFFLFSSIFVSQYTQKRQKHCSCVSISFFFLSRWFFKWTTIFFLCSTFKQLVKHRRMCVREREEGRWKDVVFCVHSTEYTHSLITNYNVISGHTSGLMVTGCSRAYELAAELAHIVVVNKSLARARVFFYLYSVHICSRTKRVLIRTFLHRT